MNEDISIEKQLFLVQEMIKENNNAITVADAKAGFNIILCSSILGVFFSFFDNILDFLKEKDTIIIVFTSIVITISLILVFLSIILSIFSVIPRFGSLEDRKKPALPYFHYVTKKIENPNQLFKKIKEQSPTDILEMLSIQSFELAKIADKKVTIVRYSLLIFLSSLFSILGLICFGLFYFRFRKSNQKQN